MESYFYISGNVVREIQKKKEDGEVGVNSLKGI